MEAAGCKQEVGEWAEPAARKMEAVGCKLEVGEWAEPAGCKMEAAGGAAEAAGCKPEADRTREKGASKPNKQK